MVLTAASAERSGTATVRITHDGELWAATRIRWNGDDSGTTPAEYLASVREDADGATLRRITTAMASPARRRLDGASVVYSGDVPSRVIARETGFKEGQAIRVLPFGHVAHDEAADADALLRTAITVGADGVVRELVVTWGTSASAWRYTVTYSGLGSTAAPVAPANARSLLERRRVAPGSTSGG